MRSIIVTGMLICTAFSCFSQAEVLSDIPKKENGYYGRVTGGVLTGNYSSLSFQFSNGYRFGQTEVGLGLGYEAYYGARFAPLFLESRYHFLRSKNTQPFVGITGGYLAALSQWYYYKEGSSRNGSYTLGANIGLTHYFTKHFGVSSSIGYRYINTQEPQYVYLMMAPTTLQREMHRLEVRIGIVFR